MKQFYISTPIYYTSGKPHSGHASSTTKAGVVSRYKKIGGNDSYLISRRQ